MPWTYENKLELLENKTLRYPGHWDQMIAYRQLGLFNENKVSINGTNISPREFYHHLIVLCNLSNQKYKIHLFLFLETFFYVHKFFFYVIVQH